MITNFSQLISTDAPYGANGSGGPGSGEAPPGSVDPFNFAKLTKIPNPAAGKFFRQEVIVQFSSDLRDGYFANNMWVRSYYSGVHSSYGWLLPIPSFSYYKLGAWDWFSSINEHMGIESPVVHSLDMHDMSLHSNIKSLEEWIKQFDFDLKPDALEHYLKQDWKFLTSRLFSGLRDKSDFYKFVNRTPVTITQWRKDDAMVYPLVLTGSSRDQEDKFLDLRLIVISNHNIDGVSHNLEKKVERLVDFGPSQQFVSVFEGELSTKDMQNDLVVNIERGKPPQ